MIVMIDSWIFQIFEISLGPIASIAPSIAVFSADHPIPSHVDINLMSVILEHPRLFSTWSNTNMLSDLRLSGWWFGTCFYFPRMMIQSDFHICPRGVGIPPIRL